VLAGKTQRDDFDRLIIDPGAKAVRFPGLRETIKVRAWRSFINEVAKLVRTIGDSLSHLLDHSPNLVHLLANVRRFQFDASTLRDDS
jgi:hypothetical protein